MSLDSLCTVYTWVYDTLFLHKNRLQNRVIPKRNLYIYDVIYRVHVHVFTMKPCEGIKKIRGRQKKILL